MLRIMDRPHLNPIFSPALRPRFRNTPIPFPRLNLRPNWVRFGFFQNEIRQIPFPINGLRLDFAGYASLIPPDGFVRLSSGRELLVRVLGGKEFKDGVMKEGCAA